MPGLARFFATFTLSGQVNATLGASLHLFLTAGALAAPSREGERSKVSMKGGVKRQPALPRFICKMIMMYMIFFPSSVHLDV